MHEETCPSESAHLDTEFAGCDFARGQGWGRRMLDHALAEARRLGFARMTLETATPLKEAIALYEKYGFRPFKPEHMVPRCDQAFELLL